MTLSTLIRLALEEDRTDRDITVLATLDPQQQGCAQIITKASGILSGSAAAESVFTTIDPTLRCRWQVIDGNPIAAGSVIVELSGSVASILAAERTALNFLQHLSGIATATAQFVTAVTHTNCAIYDTRKTVPGLRSLAKQAVVDGGGHNHRDDLAGGFLIKENHIAAAGSIGAAVARCRSFDTAPWIEVECETLAQVDEAKELPIQLILLDNMTTQQVASAVSMVHDIQLEASGGITLNNVGSYADCGVDRIAIGAITHSASALDLSLLLQ